MKRQKETFELKKKTIKNIKMNVCQMGRKDVTQSYLNVNIKTSKYCRKLYKDPLGNILFSQYNTEFDFRSKIRRE